jgi:hypothetical protein
MDDSEAEIRRAALSRVGDRESLATIATSSTFSDVRRTALVKLTDSERGIHRSSGSKLIEVARELTDEVLLAEIADSDSGHDDDVRVAAVENPHFTDQRLLSQIARCGKGSKVRAAAIRKVTDQAVLAEIAKPVKYSDEWERAWAVGSPNFTDQRLLAQIAGSDKNPDVRRSALGKPIDQVLLAEIAGTDPDAEVREKAASMLTDLSLLRTLLGTCTDQSVVRGAAKGLKKLSPETADKEAKELCSKEHLFTEFKHGQRRCVRCGYEEQCQHVSFSAWERDGRPDDRDRYTWTRYCTKCGAIDATQFPPK